MAYIQNQQATIADDDNETTQATTSLVVHTRMWLGRRALADGTDECCITRDGDWMPLGSIVIESGLCSTQSGIFYIVRGDADPAQGGSGSSQV